MEALPTSPGTIADNHLVASRCERIAWLLEAQDANPYRVRAWRAAAEQIRRLTFSVVETCRRDGEASLVSVPHIGRGIAGVIGEYARTGRFPLLESLEGLEGEALLRCLPGLGPTLAKRIHQDLGIETLEDLNVAAHDGRLDQVQGFGPRRLQAIRSELDSMLRRAAPHPDRSEGKSPSPALLLAIDKEYRELAAAGKLRTIAPRRHNPGHKSWLPIWHIDRDGWHFTVLFSNSHQAHQVGRTRDWVLVFYEGPEGHGQVTAISAGKQRVLRGVPNKSPQPEVLQ